MGFYNQEQPDINSVTALEQIQILETSLKIIYHEIKSPPKNENGRCSWCDMIPSHSAYCPWVRAMEEFHKLGLVYFVRADTAKDWSVTQDISNEER